jgi:2-polyprenyl-3-methyl-5-hydroxy-6-metoxy-1,4-benzoquinol methylase
LGPPSITSKNKKEMFKEIKSINERPKPFEFYTAEELWANDYTSEQMLQYHLNEEIDLSSRKGPFIDSSVEWISSHFNVDDQTRIADFGCGPGLYTTRLARFNAQVTGVDFSNRSIVYAQEIAQQEGLSINYINQDYLMYETNDSFDLIIMIMCDYCALSPSQRTAMLTKFRNLLNPGGSILLDVYSMAAFEKREECALYEINQLNSFWAKEEYYGFLNTFKYEDVKVVLDKYTIITAENLKTVYNWLQYFSAEDLNREFQDCGLKVVGQYADVAGGEFSQNSNEFAVVAQKE